jgi:hypothetical protein
VVASCPTAQAIGQTDWEVCPRGTPCDFCIPIIQAQQAAEAAFGCLNPECTGETVPDLKFCGTCATTEDSLERPSQPPTQVLNH